MKIVKIVIFNLILLLLLLEGVAFLYFNLGVAISNYRPAYISGAHDSEEQWMTEYQPWGAWHKPNSKGHKELRCFAVDLIANSYGARDIERPLSSDASRVVVLGDSFVEGFGVDASDRFTEKLEELGNRKFLNFGASGNFGPLQYEILYRELASKFDHDSVLIAILPDNDFTDNDAKVWKRTDIGAYQKRYRPYWERNKDTSDFNVIYPVPKPDFDLTFADYRDTKKDAGLPLKNKIQRMTWSYGVYRELRYYTRGSNLKAGVYSGYFDFTSDQLDATFHSLKNIKEIAGTRPVIFFTIPRLSDLKRLETEYSPMIQKMTKFATENGFTYIDLANDMRKAVADPRDLFLPCDGHWSANGHRIAAEILSKTLY